MLSVDQLNKNVEVLFFHKSVHFPLDLSGRNYMTLEFDMIKDDKCFIKGKLSLKGNVQRILLKHTDRENIPCFLCQDKKETYCRYIDKKFYAKENQEIINFLIQTDSFKKIIQNYRIKALTHGVNISQYLI